MEIKDERQGIKVVGDVLDIVGGECRGQVLATFGMPKRFNELKTVLNRITSSTLTKELRYLEDLKMVERSVIQETPIVVDYRLTKHGMSIKDLINTHVWNGDSNTEKLYLEKTDMWTKV